MAFGRACGWHSSPHPGVLAAGAAAGVPARCTGLRAQVLLYALGSRKPSIREYRVAGEFLCVVHAGVDDYTLMLGNEQHEDRFLLKKKDGDELLRSLWEAVLSIVPTPPLSDEHVAG